MILLRCENIALIVQAIDSHYSTRVDGLYDLYDLFPLQFMISICQAGQIDP